MEKTKDKHETTMIRKLINEEEAALFLSVAVQTLRNWRHLRKGPKYLKLEGTSVRYDLDDLEEYRKISTIDPR